MFTVLPGRKDEVELDWTPKGQTETVDRYLKTLPPDSLPIKGSQAAQDRKQLLQKQIPIHDIDPTLCHDLTASELQQMDDYFAHMKEHSVGVGHIIQFGLHQGTQHHQGGTYFNPSIVSSRYPKNTSSVEPVHLSGQNISAPLTKQFDSLDLREQRELDAFFDKIPNPAMLSSYNQKVKDTERNFVNNRGVPNYEKNLDSLGSLDTNRRNLPHYAPANYNVQSNQQNPVKNHMRDVVRNPEVNDIGESQNYADAKYLTDKYKNYQENPEINQNLKKPGLATNQKKTRFNNIGDLASSTFDPKLDVINSNNFKSLNPNHTHTISEDFQKPASINIGAIKDINYDINKPEIKSAIQQENCYNTPLEDELNSPNLDPNNTKRCKKCAKHFKNDEFAIFVERSKALYHSECFKCAGCNESLADMVYFYDKEMDDIYCGRDFAKIRGIPRCRACDELIFVQEYCLAENSTFHVKHFCCFECDEALAGKNYVVEDSQPLCLPCFELVKANKCQRCEKLIQPDEQGINLNGVHFHATDCCFACKVCDKSLFGAKLLLRNMKLYCSHDCFQRDN